MPIILFVLGIACVIGGVGAIVYGIPVKEFSFGNTMILAGTTSMVGGLIVIGLGAAISQLHRIVDMLGARPLARANRPLEPFEQPGGRLGAGPGRVPFPPKPKSEAASEPPERESVVEPAPMARRAAEHGSEPEFGVPPSLRNPDVPLMAEEEAEQLPLSPRHAPPTAAPRSGLAFPERSMPPPMEPEPESGPDDEASQTSFEPNWNFPPPPPRRPPPPSNFDAMWPSEPKNPPPMASPAGPAPSRTETLARAPTGFNASDMSNAPQPAAEPPQEDMPVGILKSGVVDGMGYTLYVDGSIEAELPDGTLRFASITELRQHLEQNS